jgi:site-specific DNA-cytosine methylase
VEAAAVLPELSERVILDLCAGSGAWSDPYARAGYAVVHVTLPAVDVRQYCPPRRVWGVLAAPPCDQFSLARNGHDSERDFLGPLEVACLRVIAFAKPQWWALENPVGLLSRWLGTPRDVWEPYEFGDAWTKRTALWGDFALPERGPFVDPLGSAMDRSTAAARSITPPNFARAFFEANP